MADEITNTLSQVLFIPHGGGPLPLLGDVNHKSLVTFLKWVPTILHKPAAILVISAHWEENTVTITSGKTPSLIYDYFGFPDEAYALEYPAPGSPELAEKIYDLLQSSTIDVRLDDRRGFDHGLFVPLKMMFPKAVIPCVQLSLVKGLHPETHIQIGKALSALRDDNVLIIGSGFSFHNLRAFFSSAGDTADSENEAFEHWLIDTCTNGDISEMERETSLIDWARQPSARYCHPREEHLIPLHVCYGVAGTAAKLVFEGTVLGKKTSAYLW